jgi:putative CocE/NonD family hydrolase
MRDGVRLFTAVYVPRDQSLAYPILLLRTPYGVGPYGAANYPDSLGPCESFAKSGYIFVYQDVRGRTMSEGRFVEERPLKDSHSGPSDTDESTDAFDTVEWLVKNVPPNNGRVGLWGVSYPGFYAASAMVNTHPAVRAASPEAPVADLYSGDDAYHGGAFMLAANFGFYTGFRPQDGPTAPPKEWHDFDYGTSDAYEFFQRLGPLKNAARYIGKRSELWDDQVSHTAYDSYWRPRSLAPHLRNVRCAVLTVGGWFDAEDLAGALATHAAVASCDPGVFNGLVMGPWVHGGWIEHDGRRLGNLDFGSDTAVFFRERILLPFFERLLKDRPAALPPPACVFETGTNVWRGYASWPPQGTKPRALYFRERGGLTFEAPGEIRPAADDYASDPAHPVPFIAYTALGVPQEYMDGDQRFASRRPDVLAYTTEPLGEDLTVAGPVSVRLFVSTSGTDSDWDVKLIDVYPPDFPSPSEPAAAGNDVQAPQRSPMGGYQQLVRGEPFRGKFRNGFEAPEPFVPGKPEVVAFAMPDINHTFLRGHRIMVQVQSSWFPLVDLNPQTFTDIPNAEPRDFKGALERVYRWREQPSGIELPVLGADARQTLPTP